MSTTRTPVHRRLQSQPTLRLPPRSVAANQLVWRLPRSSGTGLRKSIACHRSLALPLPQRASWNPKRMRRLPVRLQSPEARTGTRRSVVPAPCSRREVAHYQGTASYESVTLALVVQESRDHHARNPPPDNET